MIHSTSVYLKTSLFYFCFWKICDFFRILRHYFFFQYIEDFSSLSSCFKCYKQAVFLTFVPLYIMCFSCSLGRKEIISLSLVLSTFSMLCLGALFFMSAVSGICYAIWIFDFIVFSNLEILQPLFFQIIFLSFWYFLLEIPIKHMSSHLKSYHSSLMLC